VLDPDSAPEVKVDIPAISIQYSISFGQSASLILTTGVELDADPDAINRALDKVVKAAERQRDKVKLQATRDMLALKYQDLAGFRAQLSAKQVEFMDQHASRNRHGEWRASPAQQQQLDSLQTNEKNTVEAIVRLEKEIMELEGKCR
jgi:hypothetical protein